MRSEPPQEMLQLVFSVTAQAAVVVGWSAATLRAGPGPSKKTLDLVLLDEPLANLDYKLREELRG